MKHLWYLNKYFLRYKVHLIAGVIFVTAANVFGVLSPRLIRFAIDMVTENIRVYRTFEGFSALEFFREYFVQALLLFAGIYLLLAVIKGVFMFFMRQTIIVMSRLIEYDLKNDLFAHYEKLHQAFYRKNNTGDLMSRVAEDVSRVRMYAGPAIMYFINLVALFILVISTMIKVNPLLTVYVLLPLPILSVSIYYVNNIINRKSELIQEQLSKLTSISQEVFSGVRVVKTHVQETAFADFFDDECEEYRSRSLSLARVEALFHPLMLLLIGLSTIITIYIGGVQVIKGYITAGNVAEFVIYVNMLTWPVASLGWVASIVQRASASQKRINEFLATEPGIKSGPDELEKVNGSIEFKNVSFTYPDTGVEALKQINLKVNAGQKIALIGRTGSGKTTIADLAVRLYDPDVGQVLLDGRDMKTLRVSDIRGNISYVPQDIFLFSETIENNIRFGLENEELTDVRKVSSLASIDTEIMDFSQNYQTLVGERGVTLSGGQKQRISIARAFAKGAPIVILDDCLSAVDAKTEKTILNHLNDYLSGKSALIITHRIFTLLDFDEIIVLEDGRVSERGTHAKLLENKGIYFDLFEKQNLEENYFK